MVIGILFSGILAGLFATVGALSFGLPIWAAILLYPLAGTVGAMGFVALAMSRPIFLNSASSTEFATGIQASGLDTVS